MTVRTEPSVAAAGVVRLLAGWRKTGRAADLRGHLARHGRVLAYLAGESAGQCGPCTFGLPAIAGDFAELTAGRSRGSAFRRLERRLGTVAGRGACRHPDGAVRLASSALSAFTADVHAHVRHQSCQTARHGPPAHGILPVPRAREQERWR